VAGGGGANGRISDGRKGGGVEGRWQVGRGGREGGASWGAKAAAHILALRASEAARRAAEVGGRAPPQPRALAVECARAGVTRDLLDEGVARRWEETLGAGGLRQAHVSSTGRKQRALSARRRRHTRTAADADATTTVATTAHTTTTIVTADAAAAAAASRHGGRTEVAEESCTHGVRPLALSRESVTRHEPPQVHLDEGVRWRRVARAVKGCVAWQGRGKAAARACRARGGGGGWGLPP
jgi:hypothetical protein